MSLSPLSSAQEPALPDSPFAMAWLTTGGKVLAANSSMCALLGRDASTLKQCSWQELTHPEDLNRDLVEATKLLSSLQSSYRLRKRFIQPGGAPRWAEVAVSLVQPAADSGPVLLLQALDVHQEVLRLEQAVASQERLSRQARQQHHLLSADGTPRLLVRLSQRRSRATGEDELLVCAANPAACAALEKRESDLIGCRLADLSAIDPAPLVEAARQCLAGGSPGVTDAGVPATAGSHPRRQLEARRLEGEPEPLVMLSWPLASESPLSPRQPQEAERHHRLLANHCTDVAVLLDQDGLITWVSPSLEAVLGWRPDQWIGNHGRDHLRHGPMAAIAAGETVISRHGIRGGDGGWHWVETHAGPCYGDNGALVGAVALFRPLPAPGRPTDTVRMLAAGREPAGAAASWDGSGLQPVDPVTGLLHRGALFERLQPLLRRRHGDQIALLLCDLDQMQLINQRHGQEQGDRMLQTVASRLRPLTRENDVVGRLGGDELLVVLRGVEQLEVALNVAEKIREAIHAPIEGLDGAAAPFVPSLSIGVTLLRDGDDLDGALARADAAVHAAKACGGNQVVVTRGPAHMASLRVGTGAIRLESRELPAARGCSRPAGQPWSRGIGSAAVPSSGG